MGREGEDGREGMEARSGREGRGMREFVLCHMKKKLGASGIQFVV